MTLNDHLNTIREFIRHSDQEFEDGGNKMVAAELLWGSLAHGLIAAAEINGWKCEGHRGFQEVARRLAETKQRERWRSDVGAGEHLHSHFYQGNLTEQELQTHRAAARFAIRQLIQILQDETGPKPR